MDFLKPLTVLSRRGYIHSQRDHFLRNQLISNRSKNPANTDLQGFLFFAHCQKTSKRSKSWCVIRAGKTISKTARSKKNF
jgi:hypothetical protein